MSPPLAGVEDPDHEYLGRTEAIADDIAVSTVDHSEFTQVRPQWTASLRKRPKRLDTVKHGVGGRVGGARILQVQEIGQASKVTVRRGRNPDRDHDVFGTRARRACRK